VPDRTVLAVDLGTSHVKAALVRNDGSIEACATRPLEVFYPKPGWAEQDPEGWWQAISSACHELFDGAAERAHGVAAVVFSCQMFGVLPIDEDGKPLSNAMIWLDTRSAEQAREMTHGFPKISGYGVWRLAKWLRLTNGAPNLAGRDTISKYIWLREKRPEIWERTHKLLDVKDYLVFRCTGRTACTYDAASGGWLFDTHKERLRWSQPILRMLDFDASKLPEVVKSTEIVGELSDRAARDLGLPAGVPVAGGAGDVMSCAVGVGAVRDGAAHACLGTSSWVAAHADDRAVNPFAATGTLCAAEHGKYLVIATQETAGASLDWARKHMLGGLGDMSFQDVNALAGAAPSGSGGVHFLPWMMGERVPVDDAYVRGGFVNLALDTSTPQLVRAIYEGVAYNTRWAMGVVEKLIKQDIDHLRIAGGGAQSNVWCQVMADVLEARVERVIEPQFSGVRGAALIAMRALGEFDSLEQTEGLVRIERSFEPDAATAALHRERFEQFKRFYRGNQRWYARTNSHLDR
jgi:xylulokinase